MSKEMEFFFFIFIIGIGCDRLDMGAQNMFLFFMAEKVFH